MSDIRKFINQFDINNPDWSKAPDGFPKYDTTNLTSNEVGRLNTILTIWELSQPESPKSRSRIWKDPKGYQYLGVWQNAALLRELIRKFTLTLPLKVNSDKPLEYRLKAQMDDAARSVKRNIEEGWKRPTSQEYLQFLGYSQASLEEVKGDIRDCKSDGFLQSVPGSKLIDKGFNLRVFKGAGKGMVKGEPTSKSHPYYKPLTTLKAKDLTYEIFIELINKTDYLLRKLVESIEKKMDEDRKSYKVEKLRVGYKGR